MNKISVAPHYSSHSVPLVSQFSYTPRCRECIITFPLRGIFKGIPSFRSPYHGTGDPLSRNQLNPLHQNVSWVRSSNFEEATRNSYTNRRVTIL